jgi:biotin carboxyl carrier protein
VGTERQGDRVIASQTLTDDKVRQIGRIIETLEQSPFDFLELESDGLKLTIGRGDVAFAALDAAAPTDLAAPIHEPVESAATSPTLASASAAADTPADDDTVAVTAPLLGRFHARFQPGAPPFAVVGSELHEDTTIGLIEVLKRSTPVRAGVSGTVTDICVEDAGFVEYGQVLLRVRPVHG